MGKNIYNNNNIRWYKLQGDYCIPCRLCIGYGTVRYIDIFYGINLSVKANSDVFGFRIVPFQRGLIAADEGNYNLTGIGKVLLSDQYQIAILDTYFDHGFTRRTEQEKRSMPEQGHG